MMHRTSPSQRIARVSVLGSACLLLSIACSSATDPQGEEQTETGPAPLGEAQLKLARATSCDDLLTGIQDSILAQLGERAEQLKQGEGAYYGGPGVAVGTAEGAPAPAVPPRDTEVVSGAGGSSSGATPGASSGNADLPASPAAPQPPPLSGLPSNGDDGGFSTTTVQVKDVDEADIVKTEGDRIYLLHGGTLFVLQGWPATATELLGSKLIEGTPAEMFVKDGKAVVFSRVYGDLAGTVSGAAPSPYPYYGYSSYTKISVLDVAGDEPSLLRESFIEGDYNSARRHDDVVRAVVQDGFKIPQLGTPSIEYRDLFGHPYAQADIDAQVDAWLARTTRSVRNTVLGDWLPREFAKQNGSLVAVAPRCGDYYSPDPGLTQSGVTSLVSLDLADVSAPLGGATVLGNAERVYSNEDVVLITQSDYRYTFDAAATQQTIIHRFDISGSSTAYTASGAVPGSIHDQFSLDERDGIIRVSTTEQPWGRAWAVGGVNVEEVPPQGNAPGEGTNAGAAPMEPASGGPAIDPGVSAAPVADIAPVPMPLPEPAQPTSVSRVLTLGTDGDTLEVLGETEDFGAGEQIFSTRFIGDRGYVVTFRQTDPLFVIDLADPADPHLVGELHIPGFSNYLFPLDDGHLFSIGRDATAEGRVQGLALQIFDVTDAQNPSLAHRYVFPDAGDSPANIDHRAIAFHPDRGVVAFPHQSYLTGESTLEVFEISSTTGFNRLGGMSMADEVDVDTCIGQYFGYPPGAELDELRAQVANDPAWQGNILASCRYGHVFRRGIFRDDFVYGISNTGVYVYDFTAMDAGVVGELNLPAEVYDNTTYAMGGGTSASPGFSGSAGSASMIAPLPPSVAPAPAKPPVSAGGAGGASSSAPDAQSDPAEAAE